MELDENSSKQCKAFMFDSIVYDMIGMAVSECRIERGLCDASVVV